MQKNATPIYKKNAKAHIEANPGMPKTAITIPDAILTGT